MHSSSNGQARPDASQVEHFHPMPPKEGPYSRQRQNRPAAGRQGYDGAAMTAVSEREVDASFGRAGAIVDQSARDDVFHSHAERFEESHFVSRLASRMLPKLS